MAKRKPREPESGSEGADETQARGSDPPAIVEIVAAPPPDEEKRAPDSDNAHQNESQTDAWRPWRWFTRGTRPFTAVVAFSAVASLIVTAYQWGTMERQNALMTDLAWLERRPWLNIEIPTLKELVANKPLEIEATIRNSGPTPAYVKRIVFKIDDKHIAIGTKGLAYEPLPGEIPTETVNTIPPGEPYIGALDAKHVLTTRELKQIEDGLLYLTVFGRVDYADGQGKIHSSWLTVNYDTDLKRFTGRGNFRHMD